MSGDAGRRWVADPTVRWTILLTARLADLPRTDLLEDRSRRLSHGLGWPSPPDVLELDDVDLLRRELSAGSVGTPLRLGRSGQALVVAAHHAHVDGIGLLGALGALLDTPVHSSARGLAGRPARSGVARAALARLREAARRPPARVAGTGPATDASADPEHDVFAERVLDGTVRVSALAHAAVAGLAGRLDGARPVSLAVGASERPGDDPTVANLSALIRLTDVAGDDLDRLATRLREAPVEPDLSGGQHRAATRGAMTTALRLLRHRLGSTLLVSHLGEVTAPGVEGLAFHPVSGGASGVALGAVGLGGATTLTLRARGATHTRADLDAVLAGVVEQLRRR